MTADIIPLRREAASSPSSPPAEPDNETLLAQACSEEAFDRSERAIIEAAAAGDLRRAVIHFAALVAMNINPFNTRELEARRDGRLAAALDHIEQAARRHFRDKDNA